MRRTLVWLNLYGCEAVRRKLKNSLKTQMPFVSINPTLYPRIRNSSTHQTIILTPLIFRLQGDAFALKVVHRCFFPFDWGTQPDQFQHPVCPEDFDDDLSSSTVPGQIVIIKVFRTNRVLKLIRLSVPIERKEASVSKFVPQN